jgi:hypothetical protein
MGKTAKRQNKRAAAMLGAKGGTGAKKKSHAPVSAAAFGDAMGMQTDDAAGVNIQTATCEGHAKKSTTSVGRIARAVEADLTQEACVALDALLAEVERGERADACSLDLCSKVLGMCQRAGKAKPALRLLTRMELCGLPLGPVQLRQVFFACCAKGMTHEALALMSRRDASTGARALGKDVLVRGCGMVPGGADAPDALALLEGALRGALSNAPNWELVPPEALRFHPPALWRPPEAIGSSAPADDDSVNAKNAKTTDDADLAAAAESAAASMYPGGVTGDDSFWLVSDDDGRRRPADRRALQLWAPASAHTIPLEPAGLEPDTDRVDVPGLPGAFALVNFLTKRETAAFRAAAHAVGWRKDDDVGSDGNRLERLDYCEMLIWPETAERLWRRIKSHAPAGAVGVNARLRLFRYGPDAIYRKHVDGSWPEAFLTDEGEYVVDKSQGKVRSRLTLLVYLSDGFEGGGTTFYGAVPGRPGEVGAIAVAPKEGAALCFPHGDAEDSPVHEGSAVFPGARGAKYKYIVRTDVLFEVGKG